jgi:cytochrome bd-type quinol oxidase subunit 1
MSTYSIFSFIIAVMSIVVGVTMLVWGVVWWSINDLGSDWFSSIMLWRIVLLGAIPIVLGVIILKRVLIGRV